jgi:hypothetical protein
MRTTPRRPRGAMLALAAAALLAGCGGEPQDPSLIRLWTDDYEVRVTSDVSPPRALERITYTFVVRDKETQEPIANGEGRIFATNADGKSTWNGLTYGPEVGTYRAVMTFVTAGEWAIGFQFRPDSTVPLQRTMDWRQLVRNEAVPTGPDTAGAPVPISPPTKTP